MSYIAWDKFYRNLRLELCKKPTERTPLADLMRYSKEEYDRLIETSPRINDKIVATFKKTFKNSSFSFPEVCDNLTDTRKHVYDDALHSDAMLA